LLLQEERFSRIKNHIGFPLLATSFVLKFAGIGPSDINRVVLSWNMPLRNLWTKPEIEENFQKLARSELGNLIVRYHSNPYGRPLADLAFKLHRQYCSLFVNSVYVPFSAKRNQLREISSFLGKEEKTITSVDHQLAHTFVTYYGFAPDPKNDCLVMTHDGEGDKTCATVYRARALNEWELISSTPNGSSLAGLYAQVTLLLGMKHTEHEYKVMGLAPYADKIGVEKTFKEIFKDLVTISNDLDKNKGRQQVFLRLSKEKALHKLPCPEENCV
jgi:carbamoyltransferase